MTLLSTLKRALYPIISQPLARSVLVEGTAIGNDRPIRCLFIDNSGFTDYLSERIFVSKPRVLGRSQVWFRMIPRVIRRSAVPLDLCVAVVPLKYERVFNGIYSLRCQEYVRQVVDVLPSWEAIKNRMHRTPKGTERLIRKYGLTCRISKDDRDLSFFYHRMYLPHIRKQYGKLAGLDSFDEMEEFFRKGFLLFIEENSRPIAGSLCLVEGKTLVYRRMGVLDGDDVHIRKGGQMAVYYFSLQLALERNLDSFDLMKSRPFLNDGVYLHKRGWGASVLPDSESKSWVYFFNLGPPPQMTWLYKAAPVIAHAGEGLRGIIGIEGMRCLSGDLKQSLSERFYAPGLKGLHLLTPDSSSPVELPFSNR